MISGIGGVGKSQLACEVLHRCETPLTKIWLGASSREHLDREVTEVCDDFEAKGVHVEGCSGFRGWLEENNNWLLVVDNLDDSELLWEFTPKNHSGTVIITTRDDSSPMSPPPKLLKLDTLHLPDAQTLLQTLGRRPEEVTGSEQLAKALGCLPLGLVMAALLVLEKKGTLTFTELAERVAGEREEVREFLEKRGEIQRWTDYQLSVITLWRQQREFLCQEGLSRAATLIECLSFADYRQISFEICEMVFKTCKEKDEDQTEQGFHNCLVALLKQSLVAQLSPEKKEAAFGSGGVIEVSQGEPELPPPKMENEKWYFIHELTHLAVRTELEWGMSKSSGGGEDDADQVRRAGIERKRKVFNLMAHAMIVGSRTQQTERWEREDLHCRFPTPNGRHTHQLEFLKRWSDCWDQPWCWLDSVVLEILMLLCLWFETLFFQDHWSSAIRRPWLLREIELRWPEGVREETPGWEVKRLLLEMVYEPQVDLATLLALLAHLMRSIIWGHGWWQKKFLRELLGFRLLDTPSTTLPPKFLIRTVTAFFDFMADEIVEQPWYFIMEYHLRNQNPREASQALWQHYLSLARRGKLAGLDIKERMAKIVLMLESRTEAVWSSASDSMLFSSPACQVRGLRGMGRVSREQLFSDLVCKAQLEWRMGRRVRSAESLGMASSLLPREWDSDTVAAEFSVRSSDSPSSLELPPHRNMKVADCIPLDDVVTFFEIRSNIWEAVGTAKALRIAEGYMEKAARVSEEIVKEKKAVAVRFEEDWRLARLLEALEQLEDGNTESADETLQILLKDFEAAINVGPPLPGVKKWFDRFFLFLHLAFLSRTKNPQMMQAFGRRIIFFDRILSIERREKDLAHYHRNQEDPRKHGFEFLDYYVWDTVSDLWEEIEPTGHPRELVQGIRCAMTIDTPRRKQDGKWWAGLGEQQHCEVSEPPEEWKVLHPLNHAVLLWTVVEAVRLLQRRGETERVREVLGMALTESANEKPLVVGEAEVDQAIQKINEIRRRTWRETKEALQLRNGGPGPNCSLLLQFHATVDDDKITYMKTGKGLEKE
uniref:NB-ARC domain-containing protein n=1 Tax=Chromera velia CCMP2878 TaxID=1169474 RepID=A0A0G4I146_9ALVE|eukprot:Cvel_10069.t1-p1 / transcript=Cvel_10069.t1 / gene=Cvel_10069 / organism=Chromera_velia_CCMP2878 / gene_product=hypothetical protein / transcript_product=hypothetical protein / location=Cvel_scaffold599:36978-40348(+) / protein_length=1053 / sequence_SO=supercontig / SO=protein_coding / is_pseudo=false